MSRYAMGLDFGTNSVRALIVDCENGREVGTAVEPYASGDQGVILDSSDPNLARQHPGDYIESLFASLNGAIADALNNESDFSVDKVVGLGVDTTGSSPLPVDQNGLPLALSPEFRSNPNAQCWL